MSRHPLEEKWNTTAWDILSAIERGFRAQVDVKGKLAEYYLYQKLLPLKAQGLLESVEWQDVDGRPDFLVGIASRVLRLECKNVRSPKELAGAGKERRRKEELSSVPMARVELQKTRNPKDGTPTRGYRTDEFDVLAACLFNQTNRWDYLYIATRSLERRPDVADSVVTMSDYLVVMQPVPLKPSAPWRADIMEALSDAPAGGA